MLDFRNFRELKAKYKKTNDGQKCDEKEYKQKEKWEKLEMKDTNQNRCQCISTVYMEKFGYASKS